LSSAELIHHTSLMTPAVSRSAVDLRPVLSSSPTDAEEALDYRAYTLSDVEIDFSLGDTILHRGVLLPAGSQHFPRIAGCRKLAAPVPKDTEPFRVSICDSA
jgi:hypothetical protein